jgi:hypothetical protein
MKTKLLILLFLASLTTYAQYTTIPDVNFEKKLIALGIDSGATDGKVLTNSVNKLTSLDVSSSTIVDLTGIQDFTELTKLSCYYNKLNTLDLSNNILLTELDCFNNQLTSLDLSKNILLKSIRCSDNQLTSLDISNSTNLLYLSCESNQLANLDTSNNNLLSTLGISRNQIATIDLIPN